MLLCLSKPLEFRANAILDHTAHVDFSTKFDDVLMTNLHAPNGVFTNANISAFHVISIFMDDLLGTPEIEEN